jgi:hypothetical protein
MSTDAATVVDCDNCGCQTQVTPSKPGEANEVEPWTPISSRVESALIDIRYNADRLTARDHGNIGDTLHDLADKIERHYRVVSDDRRERVYEATNRILEYAEAGDVHRVEAQVDTLLSTIGVPDRVVEE